MTTKLIISVLLIENNLKDGCLLRKMFNEQSEYDIRLTQVECISNAEKSLVESLFDIILLDLKPSLVRGTVCGLDFDLDRRALDVEAD